MRDILSVDRTIVFLVMSAWIFLEIGFLSNDSAVFKFSIVVLSGSLLFYAVGIYLWRATKHTDLSIAFRVGALLTTASVHMVMLFDRMFSAFSYWTASFRGESQRAATESWVRGSDWASQSSVGSVLDLFEGPILAITAGDFLLALAVALFFTSIAVSERQTSGRRV